MNYERTQRTKRLASGRKSCVRNWKTVERAMVYVRLQLCLGWKQSRCVRFLLLISLLKQSRSESQPWHLGKRVDHVISLRHALLLPDMSFYNTIRQTQQYC